jgi:hypothetical protein
MAPISYCVDPITRIVDIAFLAVQLDDQSKRYYGGELAEAQISTVAVAGVEGVLAVYYFL